MWFKGNRTGSLSFTCTIFTEQQHQTGQTGQGLLLAPQAGPGLPWVCHVKEVEFLQFVQMGFKVAIIGPLWTWSRYVANLLHHIIKNSSHLISSFLFNSSVRIESSPWTSWDPVVDIHLYWAGWKPLTLPPWNGEGPEQLQLLHAPGCRSVTPPPTAMGRVHLAIPTLHTWKVYHLLYYNVCFIESLNCWTSVLSLIQLMTFILEHVIRIKDSAGVIWLIIGQIPVC